jgi:hypothetical protein
MGAEVHAAAAQDFHRCCALTSTQHPLLCTPIPWQALLVLRLCTRHDSCTVLLQAVAVAGQPGAKVGITSVSHKMHEWVFNSIRPYFLRKTDRKFERSEIWTGGLNSNVWSLCVVTWAIQQCILLMARTVGWGQLGLLTWLAATALEQLHLIARTTTPYYWQ